MKFRKLYAGVCALGLLTAACGGDDGSATDTDAVDSVESTAMDEPNGGESEDAAGDPDGSTASGDDPAGEGDEGADTDGPAGSVESDEQPTAPADYDPSASLAVGWITPPVTMDPHKECHIGCRPYWLPVYDTLYDFVDGEVVRLLAADESYSDDGLTFTVTLQDGLVFQDGTPLDAASVVASVERAMTLDGSTAVSFLTNVESVTAVDETTVEFALSEPRPNFQAVLTTSAGAVINPIAIEDGRDIGLNPEGAGSGPYDVTSFTPNEQVTYAPVDGYWRDDRGLLGELQIQGIPDSTAVANAIQSDAIDLGYVRGDREPYDAIAEQGYELLVFPAPTMEAIWLRITRNELGDRRVRQALNHAIDRETIASEVYGGDCVASSQPFREGLPMHIPDYNPYPYDPDAARSLLAEAGLEDGFSMELVTVSGNPPSELNGLLVQQYLADIGVDVALTPMASADGVAAFNAGELDSRSTVVTNQADAVGTLDYNYLPGGAQQAAVGDEERLLELKDELATALNDEAEYDRIVGEIAQEINDGAFTINICGPAAYWLSAPDVLNGEHIQYGGVFDPRGLAVAAD